MIKPAAQTLNGGQPLQDLNRPPVFPEYYKEDRTDQRCNLGMISSLDPRDLPEGSFSLVKNARNRYDTTLRRAGFTLFTPDKSSANANVINKLYLKKKPNGNSTLFRATPTSIHSLGSLGWIALSGPALTGSINDQWSMATIFNKIAFSQNGLNPVGIIDNNGTYYYLYGISVTDTDSEGNTTTHNINAPNCKYVTGFYNRIVAACRNDGTDQGPISIFWSGEIDLGLSDWEHHLEWDRTYDPSAGSTPLIDSPVDETDFITGVQGAANILIVLRQKSVWLANKQPIAENPFRFYSALPGIGCDVPHSLQVVKDGIVWADTRTRSLWHYQPGGSIEKISSNVEPLIINDLVSKQTNAYSSFNFYHNEYYLCIPQNAYTKQWCFNFDTKAWSYDELPLCHSVLEIDNDITSGLLVAELVGKVVVQNPPPTGKVADYANAGVVHSTRRIYGLDSGEINQEDDSVDADAGAVYGSEWQSKDFTFPEHNMLINYIRVDAQVRKQVTAMYLYYSIDTGLTWKLARGPKVCAIGPLQVTCSVKLITAARIRWKLVATDGLFSVTSHSLKIQRGGVSDERTNIHS